MKEEMYGELAEVLKYKKVENRTKPVSTTLPEDCRIQRHRHPDPLKEMPELPVRPPEFKPGKRYTQERYEAMNVDPAGFLWSEEKKLVHFFILMHEMAFAWTEEEKGAFYEALFPAVKMPVVEHYPWAEKPIPVPPGIRPEVFEYLKKKIASGVYEPSNSSYRTAWFCVPKRDGTIRLVHNLQPLNRVTIRDAAVPPFTERMAEALGGEGVTGHWTCSSRLINEHWM